MENPIASFPALSLAAMEALASRLALRLEAGDVVTLKGELGAGKTTFARMLIHAIAEGAPEVTSPTFALMQPYDVRIGGEAEVLWHLDLYRIEDRKELEALGLEELWPHIVLIEWPEMAAEMLPEGRLDIALTYGPVQETRTLMFRGNAAWRQRLGELL